MIDTCPTQHPTEPLDTYAQRVLTYALVRSVQPLTLDQLRQADAAAQREICSLPATIETLDQGRYLHTLHMLRLEIQVRMAERQAQEAQDERTRAGLQSGTDEEIAPVQGANTAELSPDPQARALRLLKAALTLIMDGDGGGSGGGSSNGGGRPAPLVPPRPTRPSPGVALDPRRPNAGNLPPNDGINF